jgi:RHS repeat-associated protein
MDGFAAIEHVDAVFENAANTGWRCLAEYEGSTPALARKFIFGTYLDEPLALIDVDTSENIYYYHQNRLYNVAAMTDSSGNVVERYTFSAYGLPLILTGAGTDTTWGTTDDVFATNPSASAIGNPYLYTGQRWDPETENHYYKNRYQRPTLGRFISKDPLEYVDGMNTYEYVRSRPMVLVDPHGTSISPRDSVGDFEGFWSNAKDSRFIYTCRCGWIDRSHLFWAEKQYVQIFDALTKLAGNAAGSTSSVDVTYGGVLGTYRTETTVGNRSNIALRAGGPPQKLPLAEEGIRYVAMGVLYHAMRDGEAYQMMGLFGEDLEGWAGIFSDRALTVYSLEDLPTNWLGILLTSIAHSKNGGREEMEAYMKQNCGPTLSKADARCLWDEMSEDERTMKNYSVHPKLFQTHKHARKTCGALGECDKIFNGHLMMAIAYHTLFVQKVQGLATSKLGGSKVVNPAPVARNIGRVQVVGGGGGG